MKKKTATADDWARAKRLCGLSQEDVRMAKELGFSPRTLIGNIPNKTQRWKALVNIWIRDLYESRMQKSKSKRADVLPDFPERYREHTPGPDWELDGLFEIPDLPETAG